MFYSITHSSALYRLCWSKVHAEKNPDHFAEEAEEKEEEEEEEKKVKKKKNRDLRPTFEHI